MKRLWTVLHLTLIALCVGLLTSAAHAQEVPPEIPTDLAAWFASTAALAGVIFTLTALIRKHVWKTLDGIYVIGFSLVLGAGLGAAGHYLGYLDTLVNGILFGLGAGLTASGGVDGIRALIGGGSAPVAPNSTTATDAARARLRG